MAENALVRSDESGSLVFTKWTNQKLEEVQKWRKLKSRINSISLLKYNDISGVVTTEVRILYGTYNIWMTSYRFYDVIF